MKTYFSPVLLFFTPFSVFSQIVNSNSHRDYVREIIVEESGIHAISGNPGDTVVTDLTNNAVLYCYPDSVVSFWYKIYAKKDCEISLDIYPAEADNTYNFFLYKNRGDFNVRDVNEHTIYPIRANLFKDEMEATGTGLSRTSNIDYNDTCSRTRIKQFYHTAYHGAVPALKGDVLLLNIYHIKGKDCGQQFIIQTNSQSQKFRSLYQSCYKKQLVTVKTDKKIKLHQPVTSKPMPVQKPRATYQVWDSVKHSVLDAEVIWTKRIINSHVTQKGAGEIILEKNTVYNVSFSALGYKNKNVSFVVKDSLPSFSRYVFLTPVKEGDNFTMDKIYFHPNTYSVKPGAADEMDKLSRYLLANPDIKIEIQGYTNGNNRIKASPDDMTEGSFSGSSKKLSQLRAETIKKYLMEKGVSGDRLVTTGYGGSRMIYPKPKNQEEANKNIRVGVQILSRKPESTFSSTSKSMRNDLK